MRWLMVALLAVGASACAETEVGDPACAFDETGCVPADLTVVSRAGELGPSATLRATSPLQGNSWMQTGVPVAVEWRLPEGKTVSRTEDLSTALSEAPTADQRDRCKVAGDPARVKLSLETDADRATLHFARANGAEPLRFRELDADDGSDRLRFQHGFYVLRLQASWPQGDATFIFTLCV